MHALIDVVPTGWEYFKLDSVGRLNLGQLREGDDPIMDKIHAYMNSLTAFKYELSWFSPTDTEPFIFGWTMRQIKYIADNSLAKYKALYTNLGPPTDCGWWHFDIFVSEQNVDSICSWKKI